MSKDNKNKQVCGNCKHFEEGDSLLNSECKNPYFESNKAPPKDGLSPCDSEQFAAWIVVGENFGCIKWETKEGDDE